MSTYNSTQMSIAALVAAGKIFEIPNYQRGYRWSKTEVVDLLEDIQDVVKDTVHTSILREKCKQKPYCLQPIAFDISKAAENIMVVVDGQQRLTTIFLILNYISSRYNAISPEVLDELEIDDPAEFCRDINLQYEDPTREAIFETVKKNLASKNTDNIDAYYITEAYSYITEWGRKNVRKASELNTFAIKFFYGTSIIWYEIDSDTDGSPSDYFSKTNTGRIPLTNSELIKATLMLDEYCVKKEKAASAIDESDTERGRKEDELRRLSMERLENQRIKISRQWDTIENELRNDEFWYFLTENTDKYDDTRIDFIFDIVAEDLYPTLHLGYSSMSEFFSLNRERASFIIISRYLTENEHRDDGDLTADPIGVYVWKKAWDTYMVFKEWFENREWYHFIGYILCSSDEYTAAKILKIFKDKNYHTKSDITNKIKSIVMELGNLIRRDSTGIYEKSEDDYKAYIGKLNYEKDSEQINRILLLFNVISVLNDNRASVKTSRDTFFPFSRYKKENWNLEHIHSKADGAFSPSFATEYLRYLEDMLARVEKDKPRSENDLNSLIEIKKVYDTQLSYYRSVGYDEKDCIRLAAQDSCDKWVNIFDDDLDESLIDGVGNMALLDETTNKSYKNAPFFMKRMIINDIVTGRKENISRFIPFCTRNVFDKSYTKLPNAMLHWNQNDYEDYQNSVAEVIFNYFLGGETNG